MISYREHQINDFDTFVGHQEPLLATVKWRKLDWFGHVTGHDTVEECPSRSLGDRMHSGQRKKLWFTNVKKWTVVCDFLQ